MWRRVRITLVQATALPLILGLSVSGADEPYGRHQFEADVRSHWAFQSVTRPEVPGSADSQWAQNPIDTLVWAGLKQAGLQPAGPAPRATLLRRVYLDLIGLPPTPEEVDAFVRDASPTAFAAIVDNLLARPQYGQRWARHWLDVVRYAETNGYERDGLKPQAWRYRDWVIDALNADKPYDRFLIEQLAGDEIEDSTAETQLATTMLRLGAWDDEPADALEDRYDQLDDIVATTSAAFLGLTLRCARCHDHKFEPFSQHDYARWQAIFAPLKRPQNDRQDLDREVGPHAEVAAHRAVVRELDGQRAEMEQQVRVLQWQICQRAVADGRLPAAPTGAVADAPQAAGQSASEAAKPAPELPADALQALAIEPGKRDDKQQKLLAKHAARLQTLTWDLATADERGHLERSNADATALAARYPAPLARGYIWYEEGPKFGPCHVFRRGDPRNPAQEVAPGFPAILVDAPPGEPRPTQHSTGRRLQLARWLVGREHPLTARVMVNRLWQHHFGEGIVATENDFGVMGAAPSNQTLLDWLAAEFIASGWRIKHMHRLIVLSRTYRMASTPNATAERVDPQNCLLGRFRPRRMEAEALRDTILAVSGQLNLAAGGPGVYPTIAREVLETQSRPGDGWHVSEASQSARRSVYVFVKRTLVLPEFEVLDFPNTDETCEQRVVSTVAPQLLTLLNGQFVHEQAQALARRLVHDAGPDHARCVERAYRLALSRSPSERELTAVLQFLARQKTQIEADSREAVSADALEHRALTAFCLVLLNTNEFAYLQ